MTRMTQPDEVMAVLAEGIAIAQRGERAQARSVLADLWGRLEPGSERHLPRAPLHRCAVAHSIADLQDDVCEELRWDLRALEAAADVTDEQVADAGMTGGAGALFPSLYLNLGDAYRRLGLREEAVARLRLGRACLDALPEGGYRDMIAGGLDRLEVRLGSALAPAETLAPP
jgi:hypothetical protein